MPQGAVDIRRYLTRAVTLPLVLLGAMAVVLVAQTLYLVSVFGWVDHTSEVIAQLRRIEKLLVDRETGLRGYLLTGEPDFLEPFEQASTQLGPMLENLHRLVLDNPQQAGQLEVLEAQHKAWTRFAVELIRAKQQEEDPLGRVRSREGKQQMDAMRRILAQMEATEHVLRAERARTATRASWVTVFTSLVLTTMLAAALALSARRQVFTISREYQRALGMAEDAVRLRDEFLSIATHELKTPLTSLQLYLQGFRRNLVRDASGAPSMELVQSKLETFARQVQRLSALIHGLISFTGVAAGRLELQLERTDLVAVVRTVLARYSEQLARARCEVRLEAERGIVGNWDHARLEELVSHLLTNAMKYGAGRPIEVRVTEAEGVARLAVRDFGIGIAPEDQERIFGRFERAVSDRHYGGFGLGLWLVRELANAFGGSVRVESLPSMGATFIVELPLALEAHPAVSRMDSHLHG